MKAKRIAALLLGIAVAAAAVPRPAQALTAEELPAPSAVLMEASTGKVLFEKNAHEQRACASVTKVMTLLLVMEALDAGTIQLTDIVAASDHAASMGGSDIWLEPGEEMSVDDLLKATVIMSANDAAVALAEHVSGSEDAFVEKMNERAAELGMTETVFLNCCGLDEDGHVTTAYDVALMSRALIQHEEIFRYSQTWMDELRGGKTQLVNTNKLLKSYSGITGLENGHHQQGGQLHGCHRRAGRHVPCLRCAGLLHHGGTLFVRRGAAGLWVWRLERRAAGCRRGGASLCARDGRHGERGGRAGG